MIVLSLNRGYIIPRKDHVSSLTLERYAGLASLRQSAGSKARSYRKSRRWYEPEKIDRTEMEQVSDLLSSIPECRPQA